jgi:hypothetical protein
MLCHYSGHIMFQFGYLPFCLSSVSWFIMGFIWDNEMKSKESLRILSQLKQKFIIINDNN